MPETATDPAGPAAPGARQRPDRFPIVRRATRTGDRRKFRNRQGGGARSCGVGRRRRRQLRGRPVAAEEWRTRSKPVDAAL
jgi:hypothetical protein